MEENDFAQFVKDCGYPLPNCFVGPVCSTSGGDIIHIEHQPKYSPKQLQMYKKPRIYPPPTRYVTFYPTDIARQVPCASEVSGNAESGGMISMQTPTASTARNCRVPGNRVEPIGYSMRASLACTTSALLQTTQEATPAPVMKDTAVVEPIGYSTRPPYGCTSAALMHTSQEAPPAPVMKDTAAVELENTLRPELGLAVPDSLASANNQSSTLPDITQQVQSVLEPNTSTDAAIGKEVPNAEAEACLFASPPASNSPILEPTKTTEQRRSEEAEFLAGFQEFEDQELLNGPFGNSLTA